MNDTSKLNSRFVLNFVLKRLFSGIKKELHFCNSLILLVGVRGFEPPTLSSRTLMVGCYKTTVVYIGIPKASYLKGCKPV